MSTKNQKLNVLKVTLAETLGETKYLKYTLLLKNWFHGKLKKGDFDAAARQLFTDSDVRIHNEFLLAVLQYCQEIPPELQLSRSIQAAPKPRSKKRIANKLNLSQRFQAAKLRKKASPEMSVDISTENKLRFCSKEYGLLPNGAMLQGRLLIAAWEHGLLKLDDQICTLISIATEDLLRGLVKHIVRMKYGEEIKCSCLPANLPSHILNTKQKSFMCSCAAQSVKSLHPQFGQPVTALDTFKALENDGGPLSSNCIKTTTLERLSTRISHDDEDDDL